MYSLSSFSEVYSTTSSPVSPLKKKQCNLFSETCHEIFLAFLVYFKKWIFTQPISKQNSSSIADWYYFFNDKIIVNWSTIDNTKEDNFDTLEYDTFNQPYDWKSISHFTNKEFRKQNTLGYTLVAKVSYFC